MISPQAIAFCRSIGVDVDEFWPTIPEQMRDSAAIYLSGSLVEGIGNDSSDLDVFIVTDGSLDGVEATIKKDLMRVNMIYGRQRRIDLEYWRLTDARAPILAIAALDIPVDFVAERIDERLELFIHRLLNSLALVDGPAYRELVGMIDAQRFQRYLVKRSLHKIDGATLDLQGLLKQQRLADAMLRTQDVIDLAVDAFRFSKGMTNPLNKWRLRSLNSLLPDPAAAELIDFYMAHRIFRSDAVSLEPALVDAYVRKVLYWADRLLRNAYE